MKHVTFLAGDFSADRFTTFERTAQLPTIAQVALGLVDHSWSDAKAKRLAVDLAQEVLPELKRRLRIREKVGNYGN